MHFAQRHLQRLLVICLLREAASSGSGRPDLKFKSIQNRRGEWQDSDFLGVPSALWVLDEQVELMLNIRGHFRSIREMMPGCTEGKPCQTLCLLSKVPIYQIP